MKIFVMVSITLAVMLAAIGQVPLDSSTTDLQGITANMPKEKKVETAKTAVAQKKKARVAAIIAGDFTRANQLSQQIVEVNAWLTDLDSRVATTESDIRQIKRDPLATPEAKESARTFLKDEKVLTETAADERYQLRSSAQAAQGAGLNVTPGATPQLAPLPQIPVIPVPIVLPPPPPTQSASATSNGGQAAEAPNTEITCWMVIKWGFTVIFVLGIATLLIVFGIVIYKNGQAERLRRVIAASGGGTVNYDFGDIRGGIP
ncbi:MAG: hypothetical protein NTW50_04880 [Candidatus Berkelbacteria bacterium]|nr:hypothetical protein [Candidatus Berkelbacteria bacterium]